MCGMKQHMNIMCVLYGHPFDACSNVLAVTFCLIFEGLFSLITASVSSSSVGKSITLVDCVLRLSTLYVMFFTNWSRFCSTSLILARVESTPKIIAL